MKLSLKNRAEALLPGGMNILFGLWLATEVLFAHTLLSQGILLLFCGGALAWCCLKKKVFFSPWMGVFLLLIVWGLAGALCFSLNRAASLGLCATVGICFGFIFCLYQYLLLQKDFSGMYLAYMAAAAAVILFVAAKSWPMELTVAGRFGMEAGVNPNVVGMLAAYALAVCFRQALHKNAWWLLGCLFFGAAVLLTKSTKAYAMAALLGLALLLLRFPKYWWLKLILILGAAFFLFRVVLWQTSSSYDMFFQRIRYIYENLFMGAQHSNSLSDRQYLANIGMEAFRKRPFTGYGFGGFCYLPGTRGTYSHNNFVELLTSGGLPMLALYYIAPLAAIVRGWKHRAEQGVQFALLLCITQVLMDYGMVSYMDRTALMIPVALYAANRQRANRPGDGEQAFAFLQNPCTLVRWCSSRGKLKWMPDKLYLQLLYRGCTGKRLHLDPPVTMNEKLQWTKLYDHNPLYPVMVDKAAVRDYVAERGCGAYLIPLLGLWERPEDVDFAALPERFVLKCTHDSGGVRICFDKEDFDQGEAVAFLKKRMGRSYYTAGREWPYKHLTPRIIGEAFIGDEGDKAPDDVKIYCFGGKAQVVMICRNRTKAGAEYYYFDRDFRYFPIGAATKAAMAAGRVFERPAHLEEMLTLAETLSAGLPQLRVDLYDVGGRVYFGELTLFDQSGFATDTGDDGDAALGKLFILPEVRK